MLNMLKILWECTFYIIDQSGHLSSEYNLFKYFIYLNHKNLPENFESFRASDSPIELVSLNCW